MRLVIVAKGVLMRARMFEVPTVDLAALAEILYVKVDLKLSSDEWISKVSERINDFL